MRKISRDVITSLGFGNWISTARLLNFIASPMAHCKNFASCFALRLPAGRRTLMGLASLWATSTFAIMDEGRFNPQPLLQRWRRQPHRRPPRRLSSCSVELAQPHFTRRDERRDGVHPHAFPRWPSCAASGAILILLGPLVKILCPATTYRPAYL